MNRIKSFAVCAALAVAVPAAGLADPWKDESGKGTPDWSEADRRADRDRSDDRRGGWRPGQPIPPFWRPGRAETGIPAGHLPPPGECRIWDPDRPPGHQPPPTAC